MGAVEDIQHSGGCPLSCTEEELSERQKRIRDIKYSYFRGVALERACAAAGLEIADILALKDKEAWALAREAHRRGQKEESHRLIREGATDAQKIGRLVYMMEEIIYTKLEVGIGDPGSLKGTDLKQIAETMDRLAILRQKMASTSPVTSPALRALEAEQVDDNLEAAG